jgi:hypothetical protein
MAEKYVANPAPTTRLTLKGAKNMAQKASSSKATASRSGRKRAQRKNPVTATAAAPTTNGRRSGRRRHNPNHGVQLSTFGLVTGGMIGAAGSIGIEYVLRMLPVPATPLAQAGVQGGIALGIHSFGDKFPGGQHIADTIALIVAAFAIRNCVLQFVPALGRTPIRLGIGTGAPQPQVDGTVADYQYLPDANLNDYVYLDQSEETYQ